jgi:hypothetical protein
MLYTVSELEPALAEADAEVAKIREALAEAEKMRAFIASRLERARAREAAGTTGVLHKRLRQASVNEPMMDKEHRLAISKGHSGDDDAFSKAIRAKGFSQNTLAKRVGLNQAVLSLHRRSLRRIKRSKAEAIEKLTGWPADARHWPCGIVSDDS